MEDPITVIEKLDAMYQRAWTRLMVLLAIVGILVPAIMQFLNYRWTLASERELENQITASLQTKQDTALATAQNNLKVAYEKFTSEQTQAAKQLHQDVDKTNHHIETQVAYIEGLINYDATRYRSAFNNFLKAGYCALDEGDIPAEMLAIDNCTSCLGKENAGRIENLSFFAQLLEKVEKIVEINKDAGYRDSIRRAKEAVDKLSK